MLSEISAESQSNTQNRACSKAGMFFVALFLAAMPCESRANGGGAPEKAKDGPIYVDFKSIVVPVIKKDGRTGVIALSVMAETKDQQGETEITRNLPRLRDAFIRTLYGNMDNKKFVGENGTLNIDYIKERLIKTAAYVMKDSKGESKENPIRDILFQNIAQPRY